MDLLLDVNIVLDLCAPRLPWHRPAQQAIAHALQQGQRIWLYAGSVQTLIYGSRVKYHNEAKGFNSRLDELQAALLRAKLPVLDEWNQRRRVAAARYLDRLAGSELGSPFVPDWAEPVSMSAAIDTGLRRSFTMTSRGCTFGG